MELDKLFAGMERNTIQIDFDTEAQGPLAKGTSKFGGNPDLPEGFQWSYFTTATFDDEEEKPRPLAFLAQINCAEVSAYDREGLLPDKGMLYFFYELGSQRWGFDPTDKGCAQVFFDSGETSALKETPLPADLEEGFRLPEIPIGFRSRGDVPDWSEYAEFHDTDGDYDTYTEAREKLMDGDNISKLLGYADCIQGSMLVECELAGRRGIYTGRGYPKMTEAEEKQLLLDAQEWILLFQLDTVEKDDFELMFGDCGRLYFYIRRKDLQERRFEDVWVVLECY